MPRRGRFRREVDVQQLDAGAGVATLLPMTFPQRAIWARIQSEGNLPRWHNPVCLRLNGKVDLSLLVAAFDAVAIHHPLLSVTVNEGTEQLLRPGAAPSFEIKPDVLAGDDSAVRARLESWVAQPFDLHNGPLLRGAVWRNDRESHIIGLCAHHLVVDGSSMGILVRDLAKAYVGLAHGGTVDLGEPPADYAKYALEHTAWMDSDAFTEDLEAYRALVAGLPAGLPVERPEVDGREADVRVTVALDAPSLRAGVAATGGTVFLALVTALQNAVARRFGVRDLCVEVPVGNRPNEAQETVGYFVNVVPFPCRLRIGASLDETIRANAVVLADVLDLQSVPGALVSVADGTLPVLLNLRGDDGASTWSSGVEGTVILGEPVLGYGLSVVARESESRITIEMAAISEYLSEATLRGLTQDFTDVLREISRRGTHRNHHAPQMTETN